MSIKYGELTVVYDKDDITPNWINTVFSWFEPPNSPDVSKPPRLIYLFEDGQIYDDELVYDEDKDEKDDKGNNKERKYEDGFAQYTQTHNGKILYFQKKKNKKAYFIPSYFLNEKSLLLEKTGEKVKINQFCKDNLTLFQNNPKYIFNSYTLDDKINHLFEHNNFSISYGKTREIVFGILRIKSNDNMPRYLFAYNEDEFNRVEVMKIIYNIFVFTHKS